MTILSTEFCHYKIVNSILWRSRYFGNFYCRFLCREFFCSLFL